jgi:hypothetical protein
MLLVLSACGSANAIAPKPAAKAAAASSEALALARPSLAAAPDLRPVAAPSGLVGIGRLSRPGDVAKAVAAWVSLPFQPSMVDALQPGLSQAVAFDAPVEFAFVLPDSQSSDDVKPEFVVTVGVQSIDKARSLLEAYNGTKLVERGPSVYLAPEHSKLNCAVAPSLGKVAARFVCADKTRMVEHLLPYATRGLPLENLGVADLHAELRVEPLRRMFGGILRTARMAAVPAILSELSLSDPRFDRPFADLLHAVGDEVVDVFEDADRIAIDATAAQNPDRLDLKLTLAYRGRASFIAGATADAQRRMLPPSAQFFDLPADSIGAAYLSPVDPKRIDRPRTLVEGVVEGLLSRLEVSAPLRRDVRAALDTLFKQPSAMVSAFGAPSAAKKATPSEADLLSAAIGWRIYGIEAPAAPYKEALKTFVRIGSDKVFRKNLVAALGGTSGKNPKSASGKGGKAPTDTADWVNLRSRTIAGMPAGSEVLSVDFNQRASRTILTQTKRRVAHRKGNDDRATDPLSCLFAVVPDGDRTWFVFALDDKTLLERSKVVISSSNAPRLSTRRDLASLRGQTATSAGFTSMLMAKGWLELMYAALGKSPKDVETLYSNIPHHGETPMFMKVIVSGDARPVMELSTSVSRDVFDDFAASVPSFMALDAD